MTKSTWKPGFLTPSPVVFSLHHTVCFTHETKDFWETKDCNHNFTTDLGPDFGQVTLSEPVSLFSWRSHQANVTHSYSSSVLEIGAPWMFLFCRFKECSQWWFYPHVPACFVFLYLVIALFPDQSVLEAEWIGPLTSMNFTYSRDQPNSSSVWILPFLGCPQNGWESDCTQ